MLLDQPVLALLFMNFYITELLQENFKGGVCFCAH